MTQTPHDTAGPGGQGPRVSPAQMRDIDRLRRSTTDRKIAGVAGGIARHLDVDPTIIRVLLVVLVFFGGAGLLIYGAVWLFVPEDGSDEAPIGTSGETRTTVLVVALAVAALLLLGDAWWWGFGEAWPPPLVPLVVIGLGIWLLVRSLGRRGSRQAPPPPGAPPAGTPYLPPPPPVAPRPPRARSLFGVTMAVVLLALGGVTVVELAGTALPWAVYPATALAVIAVALLVGAFAGRSTGLGFVGLLTTAVLAVAVWVPHPAFGDVDAHPVRAVQVQDSYHYTAGRIRLDLTGVQDVAALDGRVLDLSMRAGEVTVRVPDGVDVDVSSRAQGGQLVILGSVVEGRDIVNNRSTPDTPAPDLRIDLDLGFGQARVSTS